MGIQRPDLGFWDWVWDAVTLVAGGSTWPDADEDSIRAYGAEWTRLVELLRAASADFGPTLAELQELWRGMSGAEFQRHWHYRLNTVLPKLVEGSEQVATGANEAALAIEHEKYQILISVLMCCVELAFILISSFFTGGLSWSAMPGVIAATRAVVLQAYRVLLGQLERGVLRTLAREAVFEGLQEFAADFTAQSLQIAEGNRPGLDQDSLVTSMKWGVFAGLAGQGLGFGLGGARHLAEGIDNAVGRRIVGGAVDGVHDQTTEALTNFVANGVENGEWDAVPDDLGGAAGRFALGVGAEGVRERISDASHTAIGNLLGVDVPVALGPPSAPAAPPSSALGKDPGGARNPAGDGAAGGRPSAGDGVSGGTRTPTADSPVGRSPEQRVDRQPALNGDASPRTAPDPPGEARRADRTTPDAPTVDTRPGDPAIPHLDLTAPPDLTGVPTADQTGLPGAEDPTASATAAGPAPHPPAVGPIGAEPGTPSDPPAVSVTGPEPLLSGPPSVTAPEWPPAGSVLVEFSGTPSDPPAVSVTGPVGVLADSAAPTPTGLYTTVIGAVPVQPVTVAAGGGGPVTPSRSAGRGGGPPRGTVPTGEGASSGPGDPGDRANGETGGPADPGADPEVQRAHEQLNPPGTGGSGPLSGPPPAPGALSGSSGTPSGPSAPSAGPPRASTAAPVAPVSAVIAGLRGDPVAADPGAGKPVGAGPSATTPGGRSPEVPGSTPPAPGGGQGQPPAGGRGAGAHPGTPDDPGRPDGFVPRQVTNTPKQAAQVAAAVHAALDVAGPRIDQVLDPKRTRVDTLLVSVANKDPGAVRTGGTVVFTPRHGRPITVTVRIDPRLSGESVRINVPADGVARAAIRGNPEAVVSISADLTTPRYAGLLSDHLLGAMEHARQSHRHGAEAMHRADPTGKPNRSGLSARDLGRLASLDAAMARRDNDAMVLHLGDMGLLTDQMGARERLPLLGDRVGVREDQRQLARHLFGTRSAPDAAAVLDTLGRALDRAVDDYAEGKVDAAGVLDPAAPDPHVTVSVNGRTLRIPLELTPPGDRDFAVRLVVDDSAQHRYRIQLRQDAGDLAIAVETAGVMAELGDRVRLRGRYGESGDEVRIAVRSAENARLEVLRDLYDGKSFTWRQRAFLSPSVGERALVAQEIAARGLHDLRNTVEHQAFFGKLEARPGLAGHRPGTSPPLATPRPSPRLWWPHEFRRWFSGFGSAANTVGVGLMFGRPLELIATSVSAGLLGSGVGQAWADAVLGSRLPEATLRTASELGPKEPDRRVDPQDNTPLLANVIKRVPYAIVSSTVSFTVLAASGNIVKAAFGGTITAGAALGQAFLDKFADPYEKNAAAMRKGLERLEPDSRRNEAARSLRYQAEAIAEEVSQPDAETRAWLEHTLQEIRAFRDAIEIEVRSKISDLERSRRLFSTVSWVWDDNAGLRGPNGPGETYTMVHLPTGNAGAWYNEARVGGQQAGMQVPSALLGLSPLNAANLLAAGGRGTLYGKLWTVLSGQQAQARAALDAWDALHHLKETEDVVAGILDPGTVGPREPRQAASGAREQKRHDDAIDRPRTESRMHQTNKHLLGFVGSIAGASAFFPSWYPHQVLAYVVGQAGYTVAYAIGEGVQRIRPGYSERAHIDGELLGKARRLPYTAVERAREMAMLADVARAAQESIEPMPVPERRGFAATHGITRTDLHKGADAVAGLRHPTRSPALRPGPNDAGELVLSHADHTVVDGLFHRVKEIEQATAAGRRPVGLVPKVLLGELRLYLERHGLVPLTEGKAAADAARARWEAMKAGMVRRHGLDLDSLNVLRTLRRPDETWPTRVGIRDRLVVGAPDVRTPGTADLAEVRDWLADRRRRDPLQLPLLTALDRAEGTAWPGATTVRLESSPGLLRVSTPDGDFRIRVQVLEPGADDVVAELWPAADTLGRAVIGADTYEPHLLFVDAAVLGDRQRFAQVLDNAVRYLADAAPNRLNRLALPDPGQLVMYRADPPAAGAGGAGQGAPGTR
ncbi:hypothetical protein GCM10010399_71540 [Dactylosporangium fulvum]|uniref:Outer membrane channel protein CpnT-like N-terminal domain-containing protein n=1 Tax=Dactylosporangium fulvum TaxID=53359 RepID=A0ABY5VWS4_9ACTN|nr:hypothetical protein [Dactylosporangium fulvum]UWP82173.1 hypothetical protein Dfulv_45105 [Dactylosporangium fulvum]